jgi:hypothetical protein
MHVKPGHHKGCKLLVFGRQILRKIFGPIQCKERWRIRSNNKLQKLIKGEYTFKYMKAQ